MSYKIIILLLLGLVTFNSCEKEEGLGGRGEVSGNVKYINLTKSGVIIDTVPVIRKDIYITYGDQNFYQDDIKSTENGFFKFQFLRKGDYKLFAFEDCLTCYGEKNKKEISVNLETNSSKVSDVTIYLINYKDYDKGNVNVRGRVKVQNYFGATPIDNPYAAIDEKVYITYGNDEVYFDRNNTGVNGGFEFRDLIPGEYTIYVFSECLTCWNEQDTVSRKVIVKGDDLSIDIGELLIENR